MKKIDANRLTSPNVIAIMENGDFNTRYETIADKPPKKNTRTEAIVCIGSLFSVKIQTFIAANAAIVSKRVIVQSWKVRCKKYAPIIDRNPTRKIDTLNIVEDGPTPKSLM